MAKRVRLFVDTDIHGTAWSDVLALQEAIAGLAGTISDVEASGIIHDDGLTSTINYLGALPRGCENEAAAAFLRSLDYGYDADYSTVSTGRGR